MKPQNNNISLTSFKRWKDAQTAEWKTYKNQKDLSANAESQFINETFKISAKFFLKKNILEIGCSPAASIHIVNGGQKVGLDPQPYEFKSKIRKKTSHIQSIGEEIPFKDESFEIILCINTLDHVQYPYLVLKEIKRCLKKGGYLLLWLQTYSTSYSIRKRLHYIDKPHSHHIHDEEIKKILMKFGYEIINHTYRKPSIEAIFKLIISGLLISGIKSFIATRLFGLHESSFICLNK